MKTGTIATRNVINWRKLFGEFGECLVCYWLESKGWVIVERNWRTGRSPEIDIVAFNCDEVTITIEVKTRAIAPQSREDTIESAIQSINHKKRKRLQVQTRTYCANSRSNVFRVDLIVVGVSLVLIRQLKARLQAELERQECTCAFDTRLKLDAALKALIDQFVRTVDFSEVEIIHIEDVLAK